MLLVSGQFLKALIEHQITKRNNEGPKVALVHDDSNVLSATDESVESEVMLAHDLAEGISPIKVTKIRARDGGFNTWIAINDSHTGVD